MSNDRMIRLSQLPDSDKTFAKIREVIHPDTLIVRCGFCGKPFRRHIEEPSICLKCNG